MVEASLFCFADILSALKNLQDKIRRIELEDGHRYSNTYESQRSTHESRMTQVNGTAQTEEKSLMTDGMNIEVTEAHYCNVFDLILYCFSSIM